MSLKGLAGNKKNKNRGSLGIDDEEEEVYGGNGDDADKEVDHPLFRFAYR